MDESGEDAVTVTATEAPDLGPNAVPNRIAIDRFGYGWRVWDEHPEMWSMVPQNPDNTPIPRPVTWFVPQASLVQVGWRSRRTGVICDCPTYERSPHADSDPVFMFLGQFGSRDGAE